MNRSLLVGLVIGAGATAGMGAIAGLALKGNDVPPQIQAAAPAAEAAPLAGTDQTSTLPAAALSPEADAAPEAVAPASSPAPRIVKAVRNEPEYVRVVNVQPVTRTVSEPRQVCQDVEVVKPAPVRDKHQVTGSVIGGVIGGVLGNQIGDGDGRQIAKVAGAIGGAYVGNKVQERIQNSRTVTTTEQKCETVYESRELPDGYQVTYEWNGSTRTVKMPSDPGSHLPVQGGKVILTANAG